MRLSGSEMTLYDIATPKTNIILVSGLTIRVVASYGIITSAYKDKISEKDSNSVVIVSCY